MKTIWKFEIPIDDEFELTMPKYAKILSVQTQPQDGLVNNDKAFMWAVVESTERTEKRRFRVQGTGNPFSKEDRCLYVGTFLMYGGKLVWHLFEERII